MRRMYTTLRAIATFVQNQKVGQSANVTFNYSCQNDRWNLWQWISRDLFQRQVKNQYIFVTTEKDSELTTTIQTGQITITNTAHIFLQDCIISFGIPTNRETPNFMQFCSNFFASLCTHIRTKQLTSTTYHLQSNEQVEPYNNKNFWRGSAIMLTIVNAVAVYIFDL